MAKPEWLQEQEEYVPAKEYVGKCIQCIHYGKFHHYTRWRGDGPKNLQVHECAIHPGCMNTSHSLGCDDFQMRF